MKEGEERSHSHHSVVVELLGSSHCHSDVELELEMSSQVDCDLSKTIGGGEQKTKKKEELKYQNEEWHQSQQISQAEHGVNHAPGWGIDHWVGEASVFIIYSFFQGCHPKGEQMKLDR